MSLVKFISNNNNVWKEYNVNGLNVWFAGIDSREKINFLKKKITLKNIVKKNYLIDLLNNMNFHFGIVVICKNFVFASVDCARTYPIFWRKKGKNILISSKAKNIVEKNDKIDSKQLIAYQMSGYTIDKKTLWEGIYNINPGTFIFMDEMKEIKSVKYFSYEPWKIKQRKSINIKKELKEEILKIIKNIISVAKGRWLVIPLSAGLDSRLIISGLRHLNYKNVKCFSYGLKNNYESAASKVIANKLGFKWKYVEINQKIAKNFYRSEVYRQFIQNNCDGCATPTIQGLLAIDELLKINFIDKQDIIINGNSGDFITGGHVPLINSNIKKFDNQNTMLDNILDIHINKHYALWDSLLQDNNKKIIKKLLIEQIENHNINLNNIDMIEGLLEFFEFHNRQAKFVINCQRIYEFYNLNWLLPLWDKSFVSFWGNTPLKYKKNQNLYRLVLNEMNMGKVWDQKYNFKNYITPLWIKLLRFPLKLLFIFFGKVKWHKFEKRFVNYWSCNVCGQSSLKYWDIIKNSKGPRHYVSWYTLISEKILLGTNWQEIETDKNLE